jgi:hypothetical protein
MAKKPKKVNKILMAKPVALPSVSNPDGVRSVYFNAMEVAVSNRDVRLLFNEIIQDPPDVRFERRANVVTSLPHFVQMVDMLHANVQEIKRALAESKNDGEAAPLE